MNELVDAKPLKKARLQNWVDVKVESQQLQKTSHHFDCLFFNANLVRLSLVPVAAPGFAAEERASPRYRHPPQGPACWHEANVTIVPSVRVCGLQLTRGTVCWGLRVCSCFLWLQTLRSYRQAACPRKSLGDYIDRGRLKVFCTYLV